jgi:hypothetical protein
MLGQLGMNQQKGQNADETLSGKGRVMQYNCKVMAGKDGRERE